MRRSLFISAALFALTEMLCAQAPTLISNTVTGQSFMPAAITDIDGNGIADLVALEGVIGLGLTTNFSTVSVIWDVGTDPMNYLLPRTPVASIANTGTSDPATAFLQVYVADMSGPGSRDILIYGYTGTAVNTFYVAYRTGSRTFAAATNLYLFDPSLGNYLVQTPPPVAIGDVNGDGNSDIVANVVGQGLTAFSCYTGFALSQGPSGTLSPASGRVISGDFNGDGLMDFAWRMLGPTGAVPPANQLLIAPGTSGGSAAPVIPLSIPVGSGAIAAGDMNGDGRAEIVMEITTGPSLLVLSSPAPGAWPTTVLPLTPTSAGPALALSALTQPVGCLRVADFDGDGSAEVLKFLDTNVQTAGTNVYVLEVQRSVGAATPLLPWPVTTFLNTENITDPFVGDFDGDGDTDVVTVSWGNNFFYFPYTSITVQENRAVYGTPTAGTGGAPRIGASGIALGSPALSINLEGARPNAFAALLLSANAVPAASGFLVDLSPSALYLLNGQIPGGITTALGQGTFSIPVPNVPALRGFSFAAQWAIIDPASAFAVGTVPVALTRARTITIF